MDKKEGRRSRVPAGTFARSEPPAAPSPPASPLPVEPSGPVPGDPSVLPIGRRRFVDTLAGDTALAPEAPSEKAELADSRRRYVSTIVGHPTATSGAAGPLAPVVAPPKWRGAKAYLEGEEPQLRVSSIPTPPPVSVSAPGAASALPSRVTTKVGPPPNAQNAVPASAESTAAIEDAIQEMLDGQASVPMQVEEPSNEALEEIPIDELPLEEILDGFSAADVLPAASVSSTTPPPVPTSALRAEELESSAIELATSPPLSPLSPLSLAPPVEPAREKPAPQASAPAPSAGAAEPAPGPRPLAKVELRRRHASVDPVPQQARPMASSLAPAEVVKQKRGRGNDAQAGLGLLLVAAMVVIGLGGWLLTKGGYPGTAQRAVEPPKVAAAQAAATTSSAQPVPGPALPNTPPVVVSDPSTVKRAGDERSALSERSQKSSGKHERPGAKPAQPDEKDAARAHASAETGAVLRVTPRDPQADLPDTPSRDNVLAALAPIRAAVGECARGQHGLAQLDITVSSTGFVTYAVVGGDFAGTPEGSCIARAARSAQFVAFKKPRFRVIYPFSL